jgi:serine/threonine protein kinase
VAVKVSHEQGLGLSEKYKYESVAGGCGIPAFYWEGRHEGFPAMALELLGPSLDDLFQYCCCKFSLRTVLLIADQLICRLQYIHSKDVIHRDIKPSNFVMGTGKNGNCIYVIDLGIASGEPDDESPSHPNEKLLPFGTMTYASINGQFSPCEPLHYTLG